MADTRKTIAQLQTLLADNTSGNISAQDLRDMLVTLIPSFGRISIVENTVATTVSVIDTWYEVALDNTPTLDSLSSNFDQNGNGELRYTGTPDIVALVVLTISMTASASNQLMGFGIGKNGTVDSSTEIERKIATGTDEGAAAIVGTFALSTNDYISAFMKNYTGANDATITHYNILGVGFVVS